MAPSLYTTLLAAGSLLSTALAAPAAIPQTPSCGNNPPVEPADEVPSTWHRYPSSRVQTLAPRMPTLDGLASNTNVTLFVPVLGIGTQNYTCNGTAFVQTEASSGALADLYDLTALLLEDDGVDTTTIAQDYKAGRLDTSTLGPAIGLHYFSADNVPVFNLCAAPEEAVLAGAKIGAVDAPDAEADVPWLFLLDAGNGVSRKLNTVYRVDTDAGVKHRETCSEEGLTREKKYAAQYWFYY